MERKRARAVTLAVDAGSANQLRGALLSDEAATYGVLNAGAQEGGAPGARLPLVVAAGAGRADLCRVLNVQLAVG